MDEPWQIFFEEFQRRLDDVPERELSRVTDLEAAASEAYEETTEILSTEEGYGENEARSLAEAFARVLDRWIETSDDLSMDELEERLEARQQEWELAEESSA